LKQIKHVVGSAWVDRQPNVPAGSKRRAKPRPRLEMLEDRTVLSGLLDLVSPANPFLAPSDSAGGLAQAMISADGRFVAYTSNAPNLVSSQVNTAVASNIFLYDQQTGTTTLVSHVLNSAAIGGNGDSSVARISRDGRFVACDSTATNLVAGQTGPASQLNVFLFDRTTGTNKLVSHRFDSFTATGNNAADTTFATGFGFSVNSGQFFL
jgi:hypothetical protein